MEQKDPRNPGGPEKDISKHFIGGDGKIFKDTETELPDYKKADAEMKEQLKKKQEFEKRNSIGLGKLNIKESVMTIVKLIGALIAFIVALLFVFVFPGAGFEAMIVGALAAIFNALGISGWRTNYGIIKEWYQSKSVWSAIVVGVLIVGYLALNFFTLGLPAWILTAVQGLIALFGGTQLIGIWDAIMKAKKVSQ